MNWVDKIDEVTEGFKLNFSQFNKEQLNWKPNPHTWSIRQNMEHLIVVNETYYPVFNALKEGKYKTPFIGKIEFIVSFLGKTVLNAVKPDR